MRALAGTTSVRPSSCLISRSKGLSAPVVRRLQAPGQAVFGLDGMMRYDAFLTHVIHVRDARETVPSGRSIGYGSLSFCISFLMLSLMPLHFRRRGGACLNLLSRRISPTRPMLGQAAPRSPLQQRRGRHHRGRGSSACVPTRRKSSLPAMNLKRAKSRRSRFDCCQGC